MASPCYGPLLLWKGPVKQLSHPSLPAVKSHFSEPIYTPLCQVQVLLAGFGRVFGLKATHVPRERGCGPPANPCQHLCASTLMAL